MRGVSDERAPPVMLYFLRACRASRRLVRAGHDTDADFQISPSRQAHRRVEPAGVGSERDLELLQ